MLQQIRNQVLLPALAENHAVYRESTTQPVQTFFITTERQPRNMSLNFRFPGKDPIGHEVILAQRAARLAKRKDGLPDIRVISSNRLGCECLSDILPNRMSFVAMYPALPLL